MKRFKIGIDCRLAGIRHAGIGRYITELVQHLIKNQDIDWVLFLYDTQQQEELLGDKIPNNCKAVISPIRHYTLKEQLSMPTIFANENLDLLHVPHFNVPVFYTGKLVITIHDLLWHEHKGSQVTTLPAWQYWLKYLFYRLVASKAVNLAERILVPSKAVAQTLQKYYPDSENKISVTPEAVGNTLLAISKKLQPAKRQKDQLLYVGSLYPHKNVAVVLEAMARFLPRYSLTIVGSRSVFRKSIEEMVSSLKLQNRVNFKEKVSDLALAELYNSCFATVQPSFSEGFGLTGLEAMSFSCPVVASDIPVFKEIYQDGAVFFNPKSAEEFARAVKSIAHLDDYQRIQKQSLAVSKKYSWKSLSEKTLKQYLNVLES